MSSRRCSICDVEWPDKDAFSTCPQCGEETWYNRDAKPVKRAQAEVEVDERLIRRFRGWLNTVTADDFRLSG